MERSLSTVRKLYTSAVEAFGDAYVSPMFKAVAAVAGAGLAAFIGFRDVKSNFASLEDKLSTTTASLEDKLNAKTATLESRIASEIKVLDTKLTAVESKLDAKFTALEK